MSIGAMLRSAVFIMPRTNSAPGRLKGSVDGMREADDAGVLPSDFTGCEEEHRLTEDLG
jgi:hypothetical protein